MNTTYAVTWSKGKDLDETIVSGLIHEEVAHDIASVLNGASHSHAYYVRVDYDPS